VTVTDPIRTRGFALVHWQQNAVEAWVQGTDGFTFRGTLEIVTGGGKTLIALACAARAAEADSSLRVAVVVPTEALARQWRDAVARYTSVPESEIGVLGAGGKATLESHRVLIAVLNTAAKKLPEMAGSTQPLMLIVDECHRAGAPTFSRVLSAPARYRLGLSATPDRDEFDDEGEPLTFDEQIVGRRLGAVVHRFSLKDARKAGWLPEYTLHHHGVTLTDEERVKYDVLSRRVDDAADALRSLGVETSRSRHVAGRQDEVGQAARLWVQLTGLRKDLLFRCGERHRVAAELARNLFEDSDRPAPRAILFHERVDEAVELFDQLGAALPQVGVALEHSRLPTRLREDALRNFASGDTPLLVSVKSLVEGIDVPAADTGISVASTSSVRQRVQALGRVLRRSVTADGAAKEATMHLLYVRDTVDDLIYGKADWSDLTGEGANRYWEWSVGATEPQQVPDPPRTPKPTEEQAWLLLGEPTEGLPVRWPGLVAGQEYSVSTTGVVHNAFDRLIENPQGVAEMVASVRGRPGGRFTVTPGLRLILVWSVQEEATPYLAGRLVEPFRVAEEVEESEGLDTSVLKPGDVYPGPTDKRGGTYKLSQRGGGNIERAVRGGRELALAGSDSAEQRNAQAVLAAWNGINRSVSKFFVNSLGHAWYESDGLRKYLASVPEGFDWPQ
jgi:superfamily II DNA or RNA helicase